MRSHLVVLTSEMYVKYMALNTRIIFKTVQSEGLQVTWRLLTSFYFITQDISPQKSPQTKKPPKKSRTLLSSTKSESKAALSECHVKGLARQHGFNSSTNRWRENIRSVGTFRPDKAASPKDTSTRSTLCQWLSQESGTLDKVGDETNHQNTVQEKLK